MNKMRSWLIGFTIGAGIAVVLVALFSPISGEEVVQRLREGFRETMAEAKQASENRRRELEAELAQMQGRR
ncbi:MAG: YtxH domain-containing protein [bacterium]|jgi:gas vesicle protein|nr:YtxH domain-containing protein [bacterium]